MTWETWIEGEPIETIQSYAIVNAINACVNGVQSMSKDIEGLVETSSNLASVKMLKDEVLVCTSQRSSVESAKYTTARRVASSFNLCGSHVDFSEGYPGWKPNLDSAILKTTVETYEELFGKKPAIKAIHAGLECGLFKKKYPNLDMVSFGPTIRGVHSPNERLHIPAVANFYKHLLAIIEKVAEER
jgi:dipeptidase D